MALPPTHAACSLYTVPASPENYTLSLHDALPIFTDALMEDSAYGPEHPDTLRDRNGIPRLPGPAGEAVAVPQGVRVDRKSTRLNSSHRCISYAVFCLKKKNKSKRSSELTDNHSRD